MLLTLQSEQRLKKQRYENRLTKLREWREQERENISVLDQTAQQREDNKLQRIRHEQEAYNYVNFVHKQWE